jgi:hypothetical protein
MNARPHVRLLSVMQIVAAAVFVLAAFSLISSLVAIPREEALAKTKSPIPSEWERVVLNHDGVYDWSYSPTVIVLSVIGAFLSLAFLVGSAARPKRSG